MSQGTCSELYENPPPLRFFRFNFLFIFIIFPTNTSIGPFNRGSSLDLAMGFDLKRSYNGDESRLAITNNVRGEQRNVEDLGLRDVDIFGAFREKEERSL